MTENNNLVVNAQVLENELKELHDAAKVFASKVGGMDGVAEGLELAIEALHSKAVSSDASGVNVVTCDKRLCIFNAKGFCRFAAVSGRPANKPEGIEYCEDFYRRRAAE